MSCVSEYLAYVDKMLQTHSVKPKIKKHDWYHVNIEHVIVSKGGRDVPEGTEISDMICPSTGEYYFFRVLEPHTYKHKELIVDYSRPNIVHLQKSETYRQMVDHHKIVYIPALYCFDRSRDFHAVFAQKTIPLLTTFIDLKQPRRRAFLDMMMQHSENPDIYNVSNVFDKTRLQELFMSSKIVLNIHQTPHHHTFEELRCLIALCCGAIVISEKVPYVSEIPYHDKIIWCDWGEFPSVVSDVLLHYEEYYDSIFHSSFSPITLIFEAMENQCFQDLKSWQNHHNGL